MCGKQINLTETLSLKSCIKMLSFGLPLTFPEVEIFSWPVKLFDVSQTKIK